MRIWVLMVLAFSAEAAADGGVVFDGQPLKYARATVYQSPYGAVSLDIELSAGKRACEEDVDRVSEDRGVTLAFGVPPGPGNRFFAGKDAVERDVSLYRPGEERAVDIDLPRAEVTFAPFEVKAGAAVTGTINIAGHGGGRFATKLCPIKKVTMPVALADKPGALAATIDGKPWKPTKVLALRTLIDGKPAVTQLSIGGGKQTCAEPIGPGSVLVTAQDAGRRPGTMQPATVTMTPPTGDAGASGISQLAWLRLDVGKDVRGAFAARQDAKEGARWEASGTFTAELCPVAK